MIMHLFLSNAQITNLIAAILLLITSAILFKKDRETLSLATLVLGAFLLRLFMATIDPFLHNWDERFHALVAKNLIQHPLTPTLNLTPLLPYDYTAWCCNYVWVHKQPLFLWQMALSMQLFGVNVIALRLPSAIMGSIMVLFIYRMGKLIVPTQIAFFAALLFAVANISLEQTSGKEQVDHNNAAFLFYVTGSIWALLEYDTCNSPNKKRWLLLISLFAGGAILNKWLTGLLVYAAWIIALLLSPIKRWQLTNYLHLLSSLLITTLIVLPWQWYILHQFPTESRYEYAYNSKHIWEVVEGHSGAWWMYLERFGSQYGQGMQLFVLLGCIFWVRYITNNFAKHALFSAIVVVYAFFSLVAKTKMPSYVFPVIGIMYLLIAAGVSFITNPKNQATTTKQNALQWVLIALMAVYTFNPDKILLNRYLDKNSQRANKIHNTQIYTKLDTMLPANAVVVNAPDYDAIDIMFYSHHQAYNWVSDDDANIITKLGYPIAVFKDAKSQKYPNFTQNIPNVVLIEPCPK